MTPGSLNRARAPQKSRVPGPIKAVEKLGRLLGNNANMPPITDGRCPDRMSVFETGKKLMTDDELDLEAQWLKREFEKTYPRARALMDEVYADDYEAICLFESDVEAFSNQYGREPNEPLEWLAWRKDRRREEHELLLNEMCKQV